MNVAAHQEKKKKENEKTGKKEAREEERKQSTDLREAACCPNAIVYREARRKYCLYEENGRGNWNSREGQQPFLPNLNGVEDRTPTLMQLLIGAKVMMSLS